jgi:hypothetical protein
MISSDEQRIDRDVDPHVLVDSLRDRRVRERDPVRDALEPRECGGEQVERVVAHREDRRLHARDPLALEELGIQPVGVEDARRRQPLG